MIKYTSGIDIIQNLKDAGCDTDIISEFVEDMKNGSMRSGFRLLESHRRFLLDEMHKEQKQIDCLDYLVYQLKKQV